jgi:hypothetical protein
MMTLADRLDEARDFTDRPRRATLTAVQITVTARIEYDAGRDRNERGPYTWFDITGFYVGGCDLSQAIERELGREGMKKLAGVIEAAIHGEAS